MLLNPENDACQNEEPYDPIKTFDERYTTDHIRILKWLIPLIPASFQARFAFYIRFRELECTLHSPIRRFTDQRPPDTSLILRQILPFCTEQEKKSVEQILQWIENFEGMKELFEMAEMMRQMSDETPSDGTPSGDSIAQMMDMIRMFQE